MTAESDVNRLRSDIVSLRKKVSSESGKVAAARKKAADARLAASKSKVQGTIVSKLREADRAEASANTAEKARANLDKTLASKEKDLAAAQKRYDKDQQRSAAKAIQDLRRETQRDLQQFSPSRAVSFLTPSRSSAELSSTTKRDIFLSHASEDKDDVARPLKDLLEKRGATIWFDEAEIKLGQSIRREIELGISNSKFGVVIVSPHFLDKNWTQVELDALFSKKMANGDNSILPIWHKVTKDEVLRRSPLLAGVLAANTSATTLEEIAEQIARVVREPYA